MKHLFTLLFIAAFSLQLAAQAEKTLVKSIDLNGHIAVATVLNGETNFEEWDKDFVRIETTIEISNTSGNILERLVSVGRYEVVAEEKSGELFIVMPKATKAVNYKGTELIEKYTFAVNIPKNVSIRTINPATEKI